MQVKDIDKISPKDTCQYRLWENGYSYIDCPREQHNKCSKCGWNPRVEKIRIAKLSEA